VYGRRPATALWDCQAPLGSLGLSTHLTQSALAILIFSGIGCGLLGRLGVAACVAVGIGIFVLQILLARIWVQYFKLGPVEWLWRSLTYFILQPNIRAKALPA